MNRISIIIPTYNGAAKLKTTLDALVDQSISDFELLVVVDGSTDNSQAIIESYNDRFSDLKIINQENGGRSRSRNAGARRAASPLLFFLDDDIEVAPRTIEYYSNFINTNEYSILVGYPGLNYEKIKHDPFLRFRFDIEASHRKRFSPSLFPVSFSNYIFTSQVMAIRKEGFMKLGMFDERLTDSEDFDFCIRALQANFKIFCVPDLVAYHNDFAGLAAIVKRQREYYSSKKLLLQLHPEYKALLPAHYQWTNRFVSDRLKWIIFRSKEQWLRLFDSRWFRVLSRGVQRWLYSTFIYAHSVLVVKEDQANDGE
jgi:GT2 family glycosyltransferase